MFKFIRHIKMKFFRILLALLVLAIIAYACDNEDGSPESSISIYSSKPALRQDVDCKEFVKDMLLFSGDDIEWYDASTDEIKFKNNNALIGFRENWAKYDYATFYLDGMELFTVHIINPHMPLVYDDLTLIDGGYKFYLSHGYPPPSEFSDEKKRQRDLAWEAFIRQLKAEGRYRKTNKQSLLYH